MANTKGQKRQAGQGKEKQQKGGEQKSSHAEPPKTGWTGPIPGTEGGSEDGYLFQPPYAWHSKEFKAKYQASCWCKKVELEYHGDPVSAKHCHCRSCQKLHGATFQYACLYHKTAVRLKASTDPMYLKFFSTQEGHSDHSVPCKLSCRNCGSHLFDEGRNMVMAYPSSFDFENNQIPKCFAPSAHIFYGDRAKIDDGILDPIDDGVDKWSGHKGSSELLSSGQDVSDKNGSGKRHKTEDGSMQED